MSKSASEMAASVSAAMPEVTNVYDAVAGRYGDALPGIATDAKLPTQQMPMAPAPSPFVITGGGSGQR